MSACTDAKNKTSDNSRAPSRLLDFPTNNSSSEINQKKLRSIENLVQKLNELTSASDKTSTTKDHIALLCETQNPDHRYVSEILLASGLILEDLSARPTDPVGIKRHPSGHPINPDLFLVLEQTKSGLVSKPEKLHRKLVFDVVNELLNQKLELTSSNAEWSTQPRKLTRRFPSRQKLLKELCLDIEKLQAENAGDDNSDVEIRISDEEVLHRSEGWIDFDKETPRVVLEIERLIFKDLIDEVVNVEAVSSPQSKRSSRQRQLFAM